MERPIAEYDCVLSHRMDRVESAGSDRGLASSEAGWATTIRYQRHILAHIGIHFTCGQARAHFHDRDGVCGGLWFGLHSRTVTNRAP